MFSTKDLCLISNLTELINAGVTSLKIEGRLKRPSYVYATVSTYKKAVSDLTLDMSEDKANLKKIFSRGEFNESAYLYDNDDIIDTVHQSHTGEFLGKIVDVIPFKNLSHISQPHIGESWEISNVPYNESIVSSGPDAGMSLTELIKRYKALLVGQENYKRFGNNFRLFKKTADGS